MPPRPHPLCLAPATAPDLRGTPVKQDQPESSIVVCPDGPLIVRGDFEIVTPSGLPVPRDRQTVALCRCGASAIKPYCDGTHKFTKFRSGPAVQGGPVPEDG
ncbi:CDGSH iron-sulfur domain-containing protein [Pseudarthrobacter enclensis]|uniref:CDGSH iron-sulfur domain-containing protein n=1 Tax=Pseudarthrobacter enclensis TaxID=993070 RepID=UPI003F4D72BB